VDFDETFTPVTCHQTFQALLGLVNCYKWHIHQMDIKSVFFNKELENEIYIKILSGANAKEGQVWLLHKALYGLKQASRK